MMGKNEKREKNNNKLITMHRSMVRNARFLCALCFLLFVWARRFKIGGLSKSKFG